jgi:hypothetical protein
VILRGVKVGDQVRLDSLGNLSDHAKVRIRCPERAARSGSCVARCLPSSTLAMQP